MEENAMNRHPEKTNPTNGKKMPPQATLPATPTSKATQNQGDGVGEGNRAATQRYEKGLHASEQRGDSDALAQKAKEALDGPEGAELRAAEEKGKRGPKAP